ncbi:MAG: hypothetical protein IPN34_09510 [Planctomycetes bacterium]|nr:hypothetical protein [Planctomycetota bacterium]
MSQLYLLHSASGRVLRLLSEPVRAGSESVCELRLSADAPARVASLRPLDGGWFLRDESGGARLPRVNGAAALQVMLKVGDRLELAGEEWVLREGDPRASSAARERQSPRASSSGSSRAASSSVASSSAGATDAAALALPVPSSAATAPARAGSGSSAGEGRRSVVRQPSSPRWIPWAVSLLAVLAMGFGLAWYVRVDPVVALKTSVRQRLQSLGRIAFEGDAAAHERELQELEGYLQRLDQLGESEFADELRRLLARRLEKERELFALYDAWWGSPAALTDRLEPFLDERREPDPGLRKLAEALKEKAQLIPLSQRTSWRAPGAPDRAPEIAQPERREGTTPAAAERRAPETPPTPAPTNAARATYEANARAIEELANAGRWAEALELARLDLNESPSRPDDSFGPQRAQHVRELHLRALVALQNLRDEVRSLRDRGKPQSALELVRARLEDFPADGEFDQLRPLERELVDRLANAATGNQPRANAPRVAPALAEAEVAEALSEARELENALRFAAARVKLEPARTTRDEASRALVESALVQIDGQLEALLALGQWIGSDAENARKVSLKVGAERGAPIAASAEGVEVELESGAKQRVAWGELGGANLQRLCAKARGSLTPDQRFFAALPQQRFAGEKGVDEAPLAEQLLAAIAEQPARSELFAGFLARLRGEAAPAGGYEWFEGRWMTLKERNTLLEAQEIQALLVKLDSPDAAVRQAAADDLALRGAEANDALLVALNRRAEEIAQALRETKINDELQKVAALRTQLDEKRAHALALIFDQETYFYPYRPPECPGEKAKLYPAVQQEVDRRVQTVRELWENPLAVKLPKSVRTLCASLRELEKLGAQFGVDVTALSAEVAWAFGVEPEGSEPISVREFSVNLEEARALLRDRLLLTWNLAAAEKAGASSQEIRQVQITNEYRRMLGRAVLAWNGKLQAATRKHSEEMSKLGYFSHFSPIAERRTPGQRMGLEGYGRGHGENIATNGGADGAHVAWCHSSGHHRNLLSAGHTEMATGNLGMYWTQNFGGLREYLQDPLWIQLAERAGL